MFYQVENASLIEDKILVKQEPQAPQKLPKPQTPSLNDSNNKLEYTTLQPTVTPPSSSSSSSASSTSSHASGKKYSYNASPHSHTNSKRKLTNDQKLATCITTKPIYSEYLNSKCLLYIYYKGDILSVIDEHFKKSFTNTRPSKPTKKASKQSVKSSCSTEVLKDHWSTKANTNQNVNSWASYHVPQHYQQTYGNTNCMSHVTNGANGGYDGSSWGRPYKQHHYEYNSSLSKMYPVPQQYAGAGFGDGINGAGNVNSTVGGHIDKLENVKEEKTIENPAGEQPSTFLSAVVAFQNHQHQHQHNQHLATDTHNPNFSYNSSLSSSSSSSLSSTTPHLSQHSHLDNFVLNAVNNVSYRYPQYLNQEFQKRTTNSMNPYTSHLQYTGLDISSLPAETESPLPVLPSQTYATSVWY